MAVCPICASKVRALDRTIDSDAFDCPQHDKFKVAWTAFVDAASGKNATPQQWESALKKAKARTSPGEWPIIRTIDF
jgi:hypothetical protein